MSLPLWFVADMAKVLQDNSDTWQPLSLATTRLLKPNEKQNEDSYPEADTRRGEKDREAREREYIEYRLKEIRSWERRISGDKN